MIRRMNEGIGIFILLLALLSVTGAERKLSVLREITCDSFFYVYPAGGGDINGDGYPDFIIGGHEDKVRICFGGTDIKEISYQDVFFDQGSWFGEEATFSGDVNGDGYHDAIISAHTDDYGEIFIYFGGLLFDDEPGLILRGEKKHFDYFGNRALSGLDVNGDGYDDVVASSISPMENEGKVFVFFGGPDMNDEVDAVIPPPEDSEWNFAHCISSAGDFNRDGFDDILVSEDTKEAYLLYGGTVISEENLIKIVSEENISMGGKLLKTTAFPMTNYVTALGDVNHDGYPDYSLNSDNGETVFSGKDFSPLMEIKKDTSRSSHHLSLVGNKDLNHDGISDFLLLETFHPDSGEYFTETKIYLGGEDFPIEPSGTLRMETPGASFLWGCFPGDINLDGNEEIIIGANTGTIEIPYGKYFICSYGETTSIKEQKELNSSLIVKKNFPNPFQEETRLSIQVMEPGKMEISLYNLLGEMVNTLYQGDVFPGNHQFFWKGKNNQERTVSPGIYFYRVKFASPNSQTIQSGKMILLK